jgi:phosphoribosylamine---glycine ligase
LNVLVIGNGGREHAISYKFAQNKMVNTVYCAPGNGGSFLEEKCININLSTVEELKKFALDKSIDYTFVGPEVYLTLGVVDEFKAAGLKVFGPDKMAAELEGSKAYAKDFMKKYHVKTAFSETFTDYEQAISYIETCELPIVIKADGLAAGKGVSICETLKDAKDTVKAFMVDDIFKGSGKKIVVEEFLEGVEASILAITDGETILPFISAKDHKQILDGNKGPNTGGMGVIAPNPYCTEEVLASFEKDIMLPTLEGIKKENMDYTGIVFFGIMITKKGVYNLEYNVRMGDPETQAVLSLMESDFLELVKAALSKKLKETSITWKKGHACCVIAASYGYPNAYQTGFEISGLDKIESKVFIAGGQYLDDRLKTTGGRVLAVVAVDESLEKAREKAYEDIEKIDFEGIYYRKDIGNI